MEMNTVLTDFIRFCFIIYIAKSCECPQFVCLIVKTLHCKVVSHKDILNWVRTRGLLLLAKLRLKNHKIRKETRQKKIKAE